MICRFRFSAIAASFLLAASAHALEANYNAAELPTLVSEPQHETASKRITRRFEKSHYKQFQLDDEFSAAVFDRYLETLDFNRLFLTQKEVDALSKWRLSLDEQLRSGDTSAAYDIFNVSLRSRFDRYKYALTLLDNEITFDENEEMVIDRSELPWAKDDAELNELWRQRVKNDALNLKLAGKTWPEIQETLSKRYNSALKRLTQTKSEDVFQIYLNAFAREVDPHTSYLSPRNAEQFQSEMNLSLEGIGAVLQAEDDFTVIRSLVAGGPASKSKKLSPGDRIIGVGQDKEKVVDVIGWRLDDVVQLIKGPKGSKVLLQILPDGANAKSYTVTLVRDKIRLEDRAVKSEVIQQGKDKVGVISVPSFYVGLAEDTKKEIAKLKAENVAGIVMDLRNNGGGALSEASALTGLFIENGPVVQVRDSYGRVKVNSDSDNAVSYKGPLTVLINRYSASASEIFAAALQDYGRAVILGEQSFGKGTVQQHRSLNHIYDLFDKPLGHVQYTIQKFYRIDGGSTQHLGVVPDIAFPTAVDPSETGESVEDNALPWDSISPAAYQSSDTLRKIVPALDQNHQQRIKNDAEFGFILSDIAEYKAEKDKNVISLSEKIRISEQQDADKKRLARLNDRQKMLGKKLFKSLEDVPNDYEEPDAYLDEAAAITLDLAKKLNS
ncbi:carboxy terminal-processing peptidase [Grimontia hollisae]|uniref:Tail-specific protease n=1 Tax=Grimontia hollisae CIP 101886 TaxID=675812 RepID=D0IAI9_GRIHO|nr:carboxy terminal-processing peptidase [Grimontia hollisae]AMG31877.1 carboxy terminal-processing peptidase [Grimontia hollisae]EEY70907.1 tail-specific protease precursor [Grimontia hollisae CIP 101886]STO44562.1 Tail-specific protease precursor [Grimontia hollisae]STQ75277.1 Tail-specific protease precursor [Grimontia hollisae]